MELMPDVIEQHGCLLSSQGCIQGLRFILYFALRRVAYYVLSG